jgi:hypothetical protein
MENVTLTRDELVRLLKAFAVIVFGLGIVVAGMMTNWFQNNLLSGLGRGLSTSLSTGSVVFYVFYRWAWRWGWLARLMKKPLVFGVWIGVLRSDFGGNDAPVELPIVFVIRQNYLSIHISSFTQKQDGESRVEVLITNGRSEVTVLAYVFELTQPYAGATKRTSGAGELKLQGNGTELNGTYWTNSPTHGSLALKKISQKIEGIEKFQDAYVKWTEKFPNAASKVEKPAFQESVEKPH